MAQTASEVKQEQKWQAQSDARDLSSAMLIHKDPKRVARARVAAKQMLKDDKQNLKDQQERMAALKTLAAGEKSVFESNKGE